MSGDSEDIQAQQNLSLRTILDALGYICRHNFMHLEQSLVMDMMMEKSQHNDLEETEESKQSLLDNPSFHICDGQKSILIVFSTSYYSIISGRTRQSFKNFTHDVLTSVQRDSLKGRWHKIRFYSLRVLGALAAATPSYIISHFVLSKMQHEGKDRSADAS